MILVSIMGPNGSPRVMAIQAVSEQASAASGIIDEVLTMALDGSRPVTLHAKMLRLELLNVKTDLEWCWRRGCSTAQAAVGRAYRGTTSAAASR